MVERVRQQYNRGGRARSPTAGPTTVARPTPGTDRLLLKTIFGYRLPF